VIAEHEIDTVFDARAIAQLLAVLKSSPSAKLFTETDRQRFPDSIRTAVRCYLAESARTNWSVITDHICKLYHLLEKADGGNAKAISVLAKQVDVTDAAARAWLERCVHRYLTFPSAGEIGNKKRGVTLCAGCAACFATAWTGLKGASGQAADVHARGNYGCACRRKLAPAASGPLPDAAAGRSIWRRVNWCSSWR
jgi:hypothetical protein